MWLKIYIQKCTLSCHDVIDFVNHGLFKNTETWISWEQNITFLRNKKILNLCPRSYRFVAEVTFKNWMQKTLDTIIGKRQKLFKNRILLHLSTISYIFDVSNKLNKNLSVTSLELIGILTILLCITSDMETNSTTWLKMISNLKLK